MMIVHIENHRESIFFKSLELIREFTKVTDYKVNIQKLTVLLYASSKQLGNEMFKILFTIMSTNIK